MKCLIWRHPFWILETDPKRVVGLFNKWLREAGFGVVGFTLKYLVGGEYGSYAAVYILAESHFAVRIFPKMTYCEISSCNRNKYSGLIELVEPDSISTTQEFWFHQSVISETDPDKLRSTYNRLIGKAMFEVIDFQEYHFPENGYTASWILREGHLTIHTFPEDGKTHCEMTSFIRTKHQLLVRMLKAPKL